MENIKEILPVLNELIEGFAEHFGSKCEFVIHDYESNDIHTIVGITNGHVTNRKIGDHVTGIGLRIMQGNEIDDRNKKGIFNYLTQTKDGKLLKSSTIYIRNADRKVVGSICVNYDITEIQTAKNALDDFLNTSEKNNLYQADLTVGDGIDDLLIRMINDSITSVGVPVVQMDKKDKLEGVRILRDRGAFKIQRAVDVVAQYYNVSKFTIYNYLNELEGIDKLNHSSES